MKSSQIEIAIEEYLRSGGTVTQLRRIAETVKERLAAAEKADDPLVGARKVRELLGNCSEMHVWRLMNVYTHLDFPLPMQIQKRNYWRRSDILGWIERQASASRRDA